MRYRSLYIGVSITMLFEFHGRRKVFWILTKVIYISLFLTLCQSYALLSLIRYSISFCWRISKHSERINYYVSWCIFSIDGRTKHASLSIIAYRGNQ